jgi:MFS family permease
MCVLSDRIDRRIVLILVCALISVAALVSLTVSFANLILLMLVFAVFAGAVETVYSIANAHANDRTAPADFVPLASTLLMCWSIAATVIPLAITLLTPAFGPKTFIYAAMGTAIAYAASVALRLKFREPVPPHLRENFEMVSAQMPNAGALVEGNPVGGER